jgi:hypothetical protein
MQRFREDEAKRSEENRQRAMPQRAAIRQTPLPPDYRAQIDADFVRTLKDPDSRRVVFQSTPGGSLVCGTINAKNSYGGYTGPQRFAAYFTPQGAVKDVLIFGPEEVDRIRAVRAGQWGDIATHLDSMLYADCGGT